MNKLKLKSTLKQQIYWKPKGIFEMNKIKTKSVKPKRATF